MMIALAGVDEKTAHPSISVRCEVQIRREQIQRVTQSEFSVNLVTEIVTRYRIHEIPVDSETCIQRREIGQTDTPAPCVVPNGSTILIERCVVRPKHSQVKLVGSEVRGRRQRSRLDHVLRRNFCFSSEENDCLGNNDCGG